MMGTNAPMEPYLDNSSPFAGRPKHRPTFIDGVAGRLFHKHMSPGFDRRDGLQSVPMVRSRNQHNLRLFLF